MDEPYITAAMPFSDNPDENASTSRLRLASGAVLFLVLILLISALQWRQFEESARLRDQVNQSYRKQAQIEAMLSLLQDVETGQRGYVLSGNPALLKPYEDARDRYGATFASLRQMIAGEREFDGSLAKIENLGREKLVFSDRVIRLRQQGQAEAAMQAIASGEGKAIMDNFRAVVARMKEIESRNLDTSTDSADTSRSKALWLTFGLEALLLLLLGFAAWLMARNVAAKRGALERMRDFAVRQEAIFESATDGMLTHNLEGIIESLNPAVADLYGYQPDQLVGRHIEILFADPPKQEELEAFLVKLASDPKGRTRKVREFAAKHSDGSNFTADVATSAVQLTDGLHFLAVIRDATERERVARLKTEFVSTVSHELRTPLTSIAGSLGLLSGGAAGELPERAAKLIKIAHSNSQRLVRLINDILDIEKIESGKMTFDIKPVPLRPLVEQAIQANFAYAAEFGVNVELESGGAEAVALADSDRLTQVITNLLSNAVKFSPRNGTVTVRVDDGERRHRVTVVDQGPGIPEEFQPRIFSKFAQADSSDTRQKGGTGLGLSIVKEIVTRLGGSIGFETAAGAGTFFHVDLPAARSSPGRGKKRPKVLICEDDAAAADEVKRTLRKAGYASDVAGDVAAAAMLATRTPYAAILLDPSLPGGDSAALVRHLRSDPRHASTPILMIDAQGANGDVSQALSIADWFQKPLSEQQMISAVRDSAPAGAMPCILHVEDDADVLRVVASAFEGKADLKAVTDLADARAALAERSYDLVILDLGLPGGSGLELLPYMRRKDGSPIPVVIFTAQDEHPEIAKLVEATLTKSRASLTDLIKTVETVIARSDDDQEED